MSAEDLAAAAGITVARLERFVRLGIVEPETSGDRRYGAASAARLRRVIRLHVDLGVHFGDAAIIADLIDRLERLEAEMARMRG